MNTNYEIKNCNLSNNALLDSTIDPMEFFSDNNLSTTLHVPESDKPFFSDGLIFRRTTNPKECEVIGIGKENEDSCIFIPRKTTHLGLSVVKIGRYAFKNAHKVKSVILSSAINSIDDGAFAGSGIHTMKLLASVKHLGKNVFNGCSELIEADLSQSSIEELSDYSFSDCPSLSKILLPTKLTRIGDNTFHNSYALRELTLPTELKSIGDYAFSYSGIETIDFSACPDINCVSKSSFKGCSKLLNIIVPDECKYIVYNAGSLFYDTAYKARSVFDHRGFLSMFNTIVETIPVVIQYSFEAKIPDGTIAIGSRSLKNFSYPIISIPKSVELIMLDSFIQGETEVWGLDSNGLISKQPTCSTLVVQYDGSRSEWNKIIKISDGRHFPYKLVIEDVESIEYT